MFSIKPPEQLPQNGHARVFPKVIPVFQPLHVLQTVFGEVCSVQIDKNEAHVVSGYQLNALLRQGLDD